ncbi:MAG: hypothetical protein WDA20_13155 [Desulfuromonadales bacterium]
MSLLAAYADATYYQARSSGGTAVRDDAALTEDLTSASRLLERQLQVAPGAFNSAAGTRIFNGTGRSILRLRDSAGRQEFLQAVTADKIEIDSNNDGSYDGYALDLADAWVRGLPENASAHSEPYRALELLGFLSTADPKVWPDRAAVVRITGTWGWAAVPETIRAITVSMTRELRDHFGAGGFGAQERYDEALPLSTQTWRLIASAKKHYGVRIPAVA